MSTQFKLEKGTIDGLGTKPVDPTALYLVDFSKLNSVNDLVVILSAMGISFAGTHPHFGVVKPFLNLDNPIHMDKMPQEQEFHPAEKKEISLPKLKPVK
jgi:hypothetical protein